MAVRNGQDQQTIGIPIGPDTSLAIAEVLLSSFDSKCSGTLASRGFRYIDDIGCGFGTIADAESALGWLQQSVAELQLQLNPLKTKISELPATLEASWVPQLRLFDFRTSTSGAQQTDLLSYFGSAFEMASNNRTEAILRYAVQRMRSIHIMEANWPLYEALLLQCLSAEPGTAEPVVRELYKYKAIMPLDLPRISDGLAQVIETHAPLHHGSEVIWALWGAICLGCSMPANTFNAALAAADPCVALCVLHARSVGLASGHVDVSSIENLMNASELSSEHWLLAYEANVKGWLPNSGGVDFVATDKYFGPMKAAGVSFYDVTAMKSMNTAHRLYSSYSTRLEETDPDELLDFLSPVSG